ncbi:MAG: PaaI family thioesterase [Anaerolineae bacterium]|nr:PaaI family thioesterase [Anaerolineae bacterium]
MADLQPNSKHCFVCGLENPAGLKLRFFNSADGAVRATLTVADHFQSYPGIAHGGILATVLDEAMGRAAMVADPNRFLMTLKMEIRYRQPVPTAQPVTVAARIDADRGRRLEASGQVILSDGTVAVEARGLLAEMPSEMVAGFDAEAEGWMVYPLEEGDD